MKANKDPKSTLMIILLGAGLMILIHIALQNHKNLGPQQLGHVDTTREDMLYTQSEIDDFKSNIPVQSGGMGMAAPASLQTRDAAGPPERFGPPVPIFKEMAGPLMPKIPVHKGEKDKIVIIIDDLGMDRRRTKQVIDLPAAITLAFLPYAPGLPAMTDDAHDKGHEMIIHVPMEPLNGTLDPGPLALKEDMSDAEFNIVMEKIFGSFKNYVGINNHMGSKLTQDRAVMKKLMALLAKRDLLFVDSKTIGTSIADKTADEYGLAHAARDVFLDNEDTETSVSHGLQTLEAVARKRGYAIAIGHPRDSTIQGLKNWIPQLAARGFEIVPVSAVAIRNAQIIKMINAGTPPAQPPPR